ncbi:ATP-binding protein [Kitasatospora sp. NPDC096128]|uniref:ATP-binding protein n=1 Tax=Kitasatospora sp. NPDC096128 TaxID=3155547 RepID=UPI00332F1A3F
MTSIGRSLGVLEHCVVDREHDISPVLTHLQSVGLRAPSGNIRRAVAVALTHISFVYEHQDLLPGVTRGLLDTLSTLGDAYARRLGAVRGYQQLPSLTAGALSKHASTITPQLAEWAVNQSWLIPSCRVSAGLLGKPLPLSVAGGLFRQLIGVLCLLDEQDVAERLLGGLAGNMARSEVLADPRTMLEALLSRSGKQPASYKFSDEGPDHAKVFIAVVTDRLGRPGKGQGSNKKTAARNAALDFVSKYMPHVLKDISIRSAPRQAPGEIPGPEKHAAAVQRLQDLFSLPPAARPILGQALIHASWAYEQRNLLAPLHQQDNQAIGFMGSQVLNFEYLLVRAQRAVLSPPQSVVTSSVTNTVYDSVLRQTGLAPALLLGIGQANHGIPVEVGSNAFQAVIGAVYIAKNFPASLAQEWPLVWSPLWRTIMPDAEHDPSTVLGRLASSMQLHIDYTLREYGPDHLKQRRATVVLSSALLSASVSVREGAAGPSKTAARHNASEVVLGILDNLADRRPAKALASTPARDQSVARFLLAHQAAALTRTTVPLQRWIAGKLFGLQWAASAEALLEWATEADQLMTRVVSFDEQTDRFEKAFRAAREAELADDQSRRIDVELSQVVEYIEQLDEPESLTREDLDRLVRLCDIYRCMGTDDPGAHVPELIDDWALLHRGRVDIRFGTDVPDAQLTGRERAVLDALASALVKTSGQASVELLSHEPLRFRFTAALNDAQQAAVGRTCALWAGVTRTVALRPFELGIEATVTRAHVPTAPGPIAGAALAVLQPRTEPYRATVADLLHDLKNQVTAARTAASAPATTRTMGRKQQWAASQHLDQAQALAVRLKSSTSMLGHDDELSSELGSFLRSYAAALLSRLPQTISLSVPDARSVAHVALGERTLRAILDNLVGNAIEAMRHGGGMALDWTSDDNEAVIEVSDSGPGLPADVLAALESGERIRSTKPGGNGLGLLGARSLLTRAGGHLSALPVNSGTTWLITIPIAPTADPETT